jgi:DNA polymerase-3 subunit epsilon
MLALFYDTETTGLPLFKEPSEDQRQPHIVQIAACLVSLDDKRIKQSIDLIIKPDGYEIPKDMTAIHGISTEYANDVGISEQMVMELFHSLWSNADYRVAYNESFDARIVRISQHRIGYSEEFMEKWKSGKSECAMRLVQPIVNIGKYPKLIEAYRHFFGADFDGAHSAMNDVKATIDVYFAAKKNHEVVVTEKLSDCR